MDLSGNPMVLYPGDAPGEGYAAIREADQPLQIAAIEWANYTDANQSCDLKDGRDRELFFRLGTADLSPVQLSLPSGAIYGLRLYSLPSGQLYIYLR